MDHFDAARATAAYLAQLPPTAHAKAQAYTQGGHWVLLASAIISVIVGLIIVRTGWLSGLRDRIEGGKPRPVLVSLVLIPVYMLVDAVFNLPWTAWASWWREKSYGLNNQTFSDWLKEDLMGLMISLIAATIFLMILYGLIRRAPRTWWLWSGGVAAILMVSLIALAPIYIEPLFNKYKDVPAGPVREAIVKLAVENGVPHDKIYVYDGSKQSSRYTANVSGAFGSARVAISDAMLKTATLDEVRGVVGHEMGHYIHYHVFWLAGGMGLIAMFEFWLMHVGFAPMRQIMGASKVRSLADPAGLPVAMSLLAVISLLMTPVQMSLTRFVESDADSYSLAHARAPDGLASALVKTIEYRAATPSALEEFLFYDHPSVGARIRKAMDWKAAHYGALSPEAKAAGPIAKVVVKSKAE